MQILWALGSSNWIISNYMLQKSGIYTVRVAKSSTSPQIYIPGERQRRRRLEQSVLYSTRSNGPSFEARLIVPRFLNVRMAEEGLHGLFSVIILESQFEHE